MSLNQNPPLCKDINISQVKAYGYGYREMADSSCRKMFLKTDKIMSLTFHLILKPTVFTITYIFPYMWLAESFLKFGTWKH